MRIMLTCTLAVLLISSVASGGGAKTDEDKIQGKWVAELEGKKAEFDFTKDKWSLAFSSGDKKQLFKGTFKLNATKKPKEIDLTITDGDKPDFNGKTSLGIYSIDGDVLKWAGSEPGKTERPTEFPAKVGGDGPHLYLEFKRSK